MDCRALKRLTQLCGAAALLAWASGARAQRAPEDTTPPPNPGPTEQTPASNLPPCPAPEQAAAPPEAVPPPPPPVAETAPPPTERRHNIIFAPQVMSITTGAGPSNYFGTSNRGDTTDPGAAWNARVTFGARSVIALEGAYMGGVNNIDVSGSHGQLFSNGFDGDLRLQLPTRVQPYIFGGVGYNHMEVRNQSTGTPGQAGIYVGKDDQVTVPAGGGLNVFVSKHLDVDARGTYRFIGNNDITMMGTGHLHQWIAQANVGYVF